MNIQFETFEYTREANFQKSSYEFRGSFEQGWEILRNQKPHLKLSKGYRLLKNHYCGICSTDIDRHFLPFELPQATGHEVISEDYLTGKKCVVEINDSFESRGDLDNLDNFCKNGLATHSPERMVFGIDRLLGGFSPYSLVPKNNIVPLESSIDEIVHVLIEPFAACLQAVLASPPKNGDKVAVLGPRRLGSLLLAALISYRNSSKIDFEITGIVRHQHLVDLIKKIGVDEAIDLRKTNVSSLKKRFDIVYDTTASVSGFETALQIAKKEIHLKTTNGQTVFGLKHLTELVVDELSILNFSEENLNFHWKNENRKNQIIYSPFDIKVDNFEIFTGSAQEAESFIHKKDWKIDVPRFDLAIASSLTEIDNSIRPNLYHQNSLVRPRGAILYKKMRELDHPILDFINFGGAIRSSRCGSFKKAIALLKDNLKIQKILKEYIITDIVSIKDIEKGFLAAKDSKNIKVIIKHEY